MKLPDSTWTRDPLREDDKHVTVYDADRGGFYPPEDPPAPQPADPQK
ncbi:hypothetical protein [Streptomyces sp. BH104]